MLLEEFDVEKYERTIKKEGSEEGYASGWQEGRASAILTILEQWLLTAFQNDFGSYASFLIGKQYSIFEYI